MASENLASIGVEYHKEGQKVFAKLLLFGTLLLVSHALTIKPSEVDAAGIKIVVTDVVVIHGALAFTFLFHFYVSVTLAVERASFLRMDLMQRLMVAQLVAARRPFKDDATKRHRRRSPQEAKLRARRSIGLYQAFVIPFALMFASITFSALIIGMVDAYDFTRYIFTKSGAYDSAGQSLDEVENYVFGPA